MKYIKQEYENRYYIGLEHIPSIEIGKPHQIKELWDTFLKKGLKELSQEQLKHEFIGLECYAPDFMETKTFDYFALVETKGLIKEQGFVSKKLPKGTYIKFEVEFDHLLEQIKQVYQYINDNNINVHFGFDYEEYISDQDYSKEGAKLYFVLKLEE